MSDRKWNSLATWEEDGEIKRFSDLLKGPKRLPDESYEEYRERRRQEQDMLAYYRRGRALPNA